MKPVLHTDHSSSNHLFADICLILTAVIWGVNMAVMKYAITNVDPHLFNAIRLTLSAITLWICSLMEQRALGPTVVREVKLSRFQIFLIMIGFSILTGAVYQILFVIGMSKTTAGNTAIIMSSIPMWIAIISVFMLKERLGIWAWLGLTLSFIGTGIVTLQKAAISLGSDNFLGNVIVLISALAWALASVISRPILKFISPIRLAFYATAGTLPVHFVASWSHWHVETFESFGSTVWISVFYSGVFSTGLAYAMWNYGIKQLGASHASIFQNLVPLVALICSWYFLSEHITQIQILGGSLIVIGLLVVRSRRQKSLPKNVAASTS